MTPHPFSDEPTLDLERALWANGALWVAGIDEAGRGALVWTWTSPQLEVHSLMP